MRPLETRLKIAASLRGRSFTEERKKRVSEGVRRAIDNGLKERWSLAAKRRTKNRKCQVGCSCGRHSEWRREQMRKIGSVKGRIRSKEWIEKNATSVAKAFIGRMTCIQLDLANFLLDAGYELVPEVPFGRKIVDLYEPNRHLAFEADGFFWHKNRQDADAHRDRYLMKEFGLPVIRFSEKEIQDLTSNLE